MTVVLATKITRWWSARLAAWCSGLAMALLAAGCTGGHPVADSTGGQPSAALEAAAESAPTSVSSDRLQPATQPTLQPFGDRGLVATDLDGFLDQLEAENFTGAVLVQDGDTITRRGFGLADREAGIANDTETVFDIGSISKQFTGAAILRLEMDGLLSVDDPISLYLPGLPSDKADITIHELLAHTAGFDDGLGGDYDPTGRDDYLRDAADSVLRFEPGSQFSYSNVGYSLLAMIIEETTGQPYEHYLRRALFEPAGMYDTGYVLPDWSDDVIAVGYSHLVGQSGRPNELLWDDDGPYWHLKGNGGLLSSAEDMFRWHQALLENKILDEAAKEKYYGRQASEGPDSGSFYGYGWATFPSPTGGRLITHNGGNGVFFADFLRFLEDDITIYVATNSMRFDFDPVAYRLADLLLGTSLDRYVTAKGEDDASPCGFGDLSLGSVDDFPTVDALPATPSGATAAAWLDLVLDDPDRNSKDAERDRLAFVAARFAPVLTGRTSPQDLTATIAAAQHELHGSSVVRIHQADETTFHIVLDGSEAERLLSIGVLPSDPFRLRCTHIALLQTPASGSR